MIRAPQPRVLGAVCALCLGALAPSVSSPAQARSFYVRALSAGEASQQRRLDASVAAPRPLVLGLELGAYDLLDDERGGLNARASMRYATDVGLEAALRDDPAFTGQFNDLRVDLLYVQWRPFDQLELVAGRQWSWSALGVRDFDGLALRAMTPSAATRLTVSGFAGRDAQLGWGWGATDNLDVQGLPLQAPLGWAGSTPPWIAGADIALRAGSWLRADVAYQRRWRTSASDPEPVLGSERVGAAASAHLARRLNLGAQASYHTLLGAPDRLGLQGSYRIEGPRRPTLSAGADRRRPWFDSASIFNLFGANPYDELYLMHALWLPRARTRLEARAWARAFHGAAAGPTLIASDQDARALGGALSHQTRLRAGRRTLRWRSLASYQRGEEDYIGDQLLVDTRLWVPLGLKGWEVDGRALSLFVDREHHRRPREAAFSALLGFGAPVFERGRARVIVEQRWSTHEANSTNLYGVLELEAWR